MESGKFLIDSGGGAIVLKIYIKSALLIQKTLIQKFIFYSSKGPIYLKGETVIQQEHKDKIFSVLQTLDDLLEGQEWFSASENPSIADLTILANFSTIYHVGLDIGNYPNIAAWYEHCSALPGFAENENGAKMFGNFLKSKLTEPF